MQNIRENVIFDLDGTLVDTSGDIIDCLRAALCSVFGMPPCVEVSKSAIGPPLSEMVNSLVPGITDEERSAVIRAFRNCYDKSEYPKTQPYGGVLNILNQFKRAGIRMFIATNKPRVPTLRLLGLLPDHCFSDVVTPDNGGGTFLEKSEMLSYLKTKWRLVESYFIGDSPQDVIAARENNMNSIAVLYGYGDKDALRAQDPLFFAANADQIAKIILRGGKSCEF